ncbi:hypothetical protein Taro_023145 [Colocasia esculenta]|uniref:Uncharacterized protein n=1 Tax=Colocasia esculenta TaxID=4460 RepID=A0A843UWK8_COLES|nr:hypothetical protein [Colocasia esculenta]
MSEVQGSSTCGPSTLRMFEVAVVVVFGSVGGGTTFGGPWRGSGRSGSYSGIRAQGSNKICNGLITMAVPKKGTSTLLARPCRVVVRWLASQQGPCVSCRRVLLLLLVARAASMVAVFARAAARFVLGLCVRVGVSRRLREPACGVAFTGARLLHVDLVEGSCLVGCPLIVRGCLALCVCAPLCAVLCSVGILARAKQMLVCRVAPLVERCDTCLWLLLALCWLFVNSGEVFLEFFSVGSGGGELVVVALPSRLRCIAWLPCVLVRFPRTVGCCPGEVRSQDCSGLVSTGCCATSGLRCVLRCCFRIVFDSAGSAGVVLGPTLASHMGHHHQISKIFGVTK